mgnify:CR=1 FL=1
MAETTSAVIAGASLFTLLNDIAVFIRDSYLRMDVWERTTQDPHNRRLNTIGETRWWSKDVAVKKVFGSFQNPQSGLYLDINTLHVVEMMEKLQPQARIKAKTYEEALLKYETVVTALLSTRIFDITSPLSKYLQTSGLDILKAYNFICETQDGLQKLRTDIKTLKTAADNFVRIMNDILEQMNLEFEIETSLPEKRTRRKKTMPGEIAHDDVICGPFKIYEIEIYNVIIDTATECMRR